MGTKLRLINENDKLLFDESTGRIVGMQPDARTPPSMFLSATMVDGKYVLNQSDMKILKDSGVNSSSSSFDIGTDQLVVNLSELNIDLSPFTFEVVPDIMADPTISIRVEASFDGGTTYQLVGTFSQYAARRWVRSPEEFQPTHLMVYRVTGTSVASKFVIGA